MAFFMPAGIHKNYKFFFLWVGVTTQENDPPNNSLLASCKLYRPASTTDRYNLQLASKELFGGSFSCVTPRDLESRA